MNSNIGLIMINLIIISLILSLNSFGLEEMRAVWIPAWCLSDKARIDGILKQVDDAGFNTIFVEARYRSDCMYKPNRVNDSYQNNEPISSFLATDISDFDPLAYIIQEAKSKNISPHIWVTTFIATRKDWKEGSLPFPTEWFTVNSAGYYRDSEGQAWLDPALPQVRRYLLNVFMDIIVNYPADGLHLDYIRYFGRDFGYNPTALYLYEQETGLVPGDDISAFSDWRRKQVENFILELRGELISVKPDVLLSAAVFGNYKDAKNAYFQDWVSWVNDGLVDFITPMCYSSLASTVKSQVDFAREMVGGERVVVGLGILERSKGFDDPEGFYERVDTVRSLHTSGLSIFSNETLLERDGVYLEYIAGEFSQQRANPPDFLAMRQVRKEFEIVRFTREDEEFYSIKYESELPHRYAYLLAKELRNFTDEVFIYEDEGIYTVYVGKDRNYSYIERLSHTLGYM